MQSEGPEFESHDVCINTLLLSRLFNTYLVYRYVHVHISGLISVQKLIKRVERSWSHIRVVKHGKNYI